MDHCRTFTLVLTVNNICLKSVLHVVVLHWKNVTRQQQVQKQTQGKCDTNMER